MTATVGALCAGYGGLELGLGLAGVDHRLGWYCEIDPDASAVMAANYPTVPNLGDLCELTDPPAADIITAGFPCQPVSFAGARAGVEDERWLIRDVVSVWRRSGARWLILENVSGLLSANGGEAFGQVVDSLAEVGASARWACLRASDVGACHRRERWFCVARDSDDQEHGEVGGVSEGYADVGRVRVTSRDAESSRRDESAIEGPGSDRQPTRALGGSGGATPDADGATVGPQPVVIGGSCDQAEPGPDWTTAADARGFGPYAQAVDRWASITGRSAPDPTTDGRLSARFVEWMMGLPDGWVTGHGLTQAKALRVLGNGVVPQQAAVAIAGLEVEQ